MGVTDGTVLGKTKIVDHGSPSERWNLVLVGDGYRASEMATYHTNAQDFVDALFGEPPFNDTYLFGSRLSDAINVYRIDVTSTDSGADDPAVCGGSGAMPATYFDARFCNSGIRRLLQVTDATVQTVVSAQLPQAHMTMALVNSPIYGGSGGAVATVSMAAGANEIGLHEMGHTAFGLADEYEYWAGCGVDTANNNHPASEPSEPNVTIDNNRSSIKWASLIAASTPMPTTNNADCTLCDPQPNPLPVGTVGAFEGAHYYHCDAYRPEFNCKMRALGYPFCAVCKQRIRQTLSPFMPDFRIPFEDIFDLLSRVRDWVADPAPFDLIRLVEVLRRAAARPEAAAMLQGDELSLLLQQIDRMDTGRLRALLLRVNASMARLETAADMIQGQLRK